MDQTANVSLRWSFVPILHRVSMESFSQFDAIEILAIFSRQVTAGDIL